MQMNSSEGAKNNDAVNVDIVRKKKLYPQLTLFFSASLLAFFLVLITDIYFKVTLKSIISHLIITVVIFLFPIFLYILSILIRVLFHFVLNTFGSVSHYLRNNVASLTRNKKILYAIDALFIVFLAFFLLRSISSSSPVHADASRPSSSSSTPMQQRYTSKLTSSTTTLAMILPSFLVIAILFGLLLWYTFSTSSNTESPPPVSFPKPYTTKPAPSVGSSFHKRHESSSHPVPVQEPFYQGVVEETPLSKNAFAQSVSRTLPPSQYTTKDVEDSIFSNRRVMYEYYLKQQYREEELNQQQSSSKVFDQSRIDMNTAYNSYRYMPATPLRCITTSITEPEYCNLSKAYLLLKDLGFEDTYRFIYEVLQKRMSIFVNKQSSQILFPRDSPNPISFMILFICFVSFILYIIQRLLYLAQDDYFSHYQYDHITKYSTDNPQSDVMTDSEILLQLFFIYLGSLLNDDWKTLYSNYVLPKDHVINPATTYLSKLSIRLDNFNPPHYNIYYENQRWNMLNKRDNVFVTMICFIAALRYFHLSIQGSTTHDIPKELIDMFIHY